MHEPLDNCTALVVDDDSRMRRLVCAGLEPLGFARVLTADGSEAAQRILSDAAVDLVVTDLDMPGLDGIGLMGWAREHCPSPVWIILSGVDTFDAAVEGIHHGAFDFLTKPPEFQKLQVAARNALEHRRLLAEKERLLAELRASSVELLQKVQELEQKSEVIANDLRRAEILQRALLPSRPPKVSGWRFDAIYRSGTNVGGDLYDVVAVGDDAIVFYVADATGHGVSAAMLSVLFKQRLAVTDEDGSVLGPADALARVGRRLLEDTLAPGLFLTVAYCVLDPRAGTLRMASAGHPPLVLQRVDGELRMLERTGPALGLTETPAYAEHALTLERGDRLLLYTDGILETLGTDGARAATADALGDRAADGRESLRRLLEAASTGCDAMHDRDDVTMVLAEFGGAGTSHFDNAADEVAAEPEEAEKDEAGFAAPEDRAVVWGGSARGATCLLVRGRGTWTHGDAFLRAACQAVDDGHHLAVDLTQCEYLDSTFLGTLHAIVCRAEPSRVRVHAPTAAVRALFEELGLERVTGCIESDAVRMTVALEPLRVTRSGSRASQLRVLRAHETLASLSEANRERFAGLVAALRAELGER